MNITVPIYIKNGDLPNQAGKNTHLNLCQIFNQHVPDQTIGAQLVHGIWSIWIKDRRARDYMINIVKAIELEGRLIEIHDLYPTSKIIPNEKIIFKDLPPGVNDTTYHHKIFERTTRYFCEIGCCLGTNQRQKQSTYSSLFWRPICICQAFVFSGAPTNFPP